MLNRGFSLPPVRLVSAKEPRIDESVSARFFLHPDKNLQVNLQIYLWLFGYFWGMLGEAAQTLAVLTSLDHSQSTGWTCCCFWLGDALKMKSEVP